jgi:hypothetical protein
MKDLPKMTPEFQVVPAPKGAELPDEALHDLDNPIANFLADQLAATSLPNPQQTTK